MSVAYTGNLAQDEMLRESIAASSNFQTLVRAANATEAKEQIITFMSLDDGDDELDRPRVFIVDANVGAPQEQLGPGDYKTGQGSLEVTVELDVPDSVEWNDYRGQKTWVKNFMSDLMGDIHSNSRAGEPYLNVISMQPTDNSPGVVAIENQDAPGSGQKARQYYYQFSLEVTYA